MTLKPEMPAFSYAQAAKGAAKSLSGTPTPTKAISAESENADHKPEDQTNSATTTDLAPTTSESETPRNTEKVATSETDDSEFTTVTSKHATAKTKAAASRTSSPSKDPHASNTVNGSSDATSDKQSLAGEQTEKQEGGAGDAKDKPADSEKSVPPKELKVAPLPTVNIWQQRKEAQEAKSKAVSALHPAGTAVKTASVKADEGQQDLPKTSSKKKGTDGVPDGSKDRKKAEGGKGREDGSSLPPVGDASLWPTPQIAQGEEKKKAQEKTEKSDQTSKSPVMRPHGKEKWTPVPYVPTAVFNTPLPSSGRSRGGRAARGGRDGGRGGSHGTGGATASEKGASAQAVQGSTSKQTSGERGRNDSGSGRATSLPAQSRRPASTDAGPTGEVRKASQPADRNRGARSGEDANLSTSKQATENFARPQREGKPFARNQGDRNARGAHLAVDSQAAARANDRRLENGSKSADFYRESGFSDFNRERGDSRAERGRGSNRGRGMYSTFGGQNSQFANASIPNNAFVTPKSFGFNDRQRSQQHGLPNGTQQVGRMPLRSPSLPASASVYGVYPFPADLNTMYGYQAVNPGPMSAVPYQQYMEPFSLMTMLSMQLEYYFSVDNMCKDMFLRRHMDSQGFVPLSVIAGFKRVKSLTEDFELLRHISRQLRNVEHQVSEDGVDRLRPRDKWAQWILPVDQRDLSAQHDGAPPAKHAGKTDENVPFNNHVDGALNGSAHGGPHQFVPNGTVRGAQTSLSSTAPEFMPSMLPTAQNEIANVGTPMDPSLQDCDSVQSISSSYTPLTPFDDSFVDALHSARGLDSYSENLSGLPFGTTVHPIGFDAGDMLGQSAQPVPQLTDEPSSRKHQRPSEKGVLSENLRDDVYESSNGLDSGAFRSRDRPVTGPHSLVLGPPYRSWSQYLTRNFDSQLYNDFRRLALDDFLTRDVDYGFNALLDFYHVYLLGDRPLADQVIEDLVCLSRAGCTSQVAKPVFQLLRAAMWSGKMQPRNRRIAGHYYNARYGKSKSGKPSRQE